jgi:hypothetical protein
MSNGTTTTAPSTVYIWPPPPSVYMDYATCIQMRNLVATAIQNALASGVQSYHIGSRSLSRYSLAELQNMLTFWITRANDALNGGSSARVRRGSPCDV